MISRYKKRARAPRYSFAVISLALRQILYTAFTALKIGPAVSKKRVTFFIQIERFEAVFDGMIESEENTQHRYDKNGISLPFFNYRFNNRLVLFLTKILHRK